MWMKKEVENEGGRKQSGSQNGGRKCEKNVQEQKYNKISKRLCFRMNSISKHQEATSKPDVVVFTFDPSSQEADRSL